MRRWMGSLVVLAVLGGSACGRLGGGAPTQDYRVTLEAVGPVLIPPTELGITPVPVYGTGLLSMAATFAGKRLAEQHRLDACKLESHGARLEGRAVVASASAFCLLDGVEVSEVLTLRLEPVSEEEG